MPEQISQGGMPGHREFIPHRIETQNKDGSMLIKSAYPLGNYARNTGEWLKKWAQQTPDNVFIAERYGEGWRELKYAETLAIVRAIASSLLSRGLDRSRPVAILSGNSVNHALLALAAQYVGIPTVPLTEQYSLIPEAHNRLVYILNKIRPVMVYAENARQYSSALQLELIRDIEKVVSVAEGAPGPVTEFSQLLSGAAGYDPDPVCDGIDGDTLAKILFTSGSSSEPKGVCTTHRMMCVNQVQLAACYPFLSTKTHRIVDWLPWNHVFGGSHNFNMMLANGGSLYIDDGKPVREKFGRTLENMVSCAGGTLAFNVPIAYEMLLKECRNNAGFARHFFADLDMIFYAGASLPQPVWEGLHEIAIRECGTVPMMSTSWGMTETAPAAIAIHEPASRSGIIGVPVPGVEVKLTENDDDRYELRVRGPNIMPGYYDDAEKTAAAFDEEGFLITGDAVRFVDGNNPSKGLIFDGRISEDFKLATGTWVRASVLRLSALESLGKLAEDIVICGHDRDDIGVLIFPRKMYLSENQIETADIAGALSGEKLQSEVLKILHKMEALSTGSSRRIARALVLSEMPSIENNEITGKGNLNVRNVLKHRAALVERLYDNNDPCVIRIEV